MVLKVNSGLIFVLHKKEKKKDLGFNHMHYITT